MFEKLQIIILPIIRYTCVIVWLVGMVLMLNFLIPSPDFSVLYSIYIWLVLIFNVYNDWVKLHWRYETYFHILTTIVNYALVLTYSSWSASLRMTE